MLRIEKICKKHGAALICNNINLEIKQGEFFSILGPSGCGKTTLLRIISGLLQQDSGSLYLNDKCLDRVPPHKRDVNTIFQNYALFPHLNVYENVAFGLRMKNVPEKEIRQRVTDALKLVELPDFEKRSTSQLSGGQQQRIAIARAVVNRPSVLLLDEPLAALDVKLRKQMQIQLKKLQRELRMTFICVTHDQEEALTMADRIALFNKGCIEQVGTPDEIYNKPQTHFVAEFIGQANFFRSSRLEVAGSEISLQMENQAPIYGLLNGNAAKIGSNPSSKVEIAVRPEKMKISKEVPESNKHFNKAKGKIEDVVYSGAMLQYFVRLSMGATVLVSEQSYNANSGYHAGDEVNVIWPVENSIVIVE